jgi:hypothetical protein
MTPPSVCVNRQHGRTLPTSQPAELALRPVVLLRDGADRNVHNDGALASDSSDMNSPGDLSRSFLVTRNNMNPARKKVVMPIKVARARRQFFGCIRV